MSIEFTRVPLYNNNIPKKEVTSMKKKFRAIHLVDFEEVMKEAEMLSGLAHVCLLCFINSFESDIFTGAFECLANEASKLSEHCNKLMQEAEE